MKKNKIILYDATETVFTHNGICVLHPIECFINRDLTEYGYDLEMVHPIDDETGRWKHIKENRIIKANGQLFRIVYTNISVIDNTIEVYAKHIFFDLQKNFIEKADIIAKNGSLALGQILNATSYGHNFTGFSDITTVSNLDCSRKNVLDALLGDEDSFINVWTGEFDVDNFNLKFVNQVGEDKGYKIKYGKNLTGLTVKTDFTEVVTRIRPVGYDDIELPDGQKYVDSPKIGDYAMPIIKEYIYEDVKWTGSPNYQENEEDTSSIFERLELAQAELRRRASIEFANKEADLPKVTCEINFVDLSTTEEYSQFKNLETVSLGDIVTIEHLPLNISMKARCISYRYNCLKEEYEEITIGHYVKNFFKETSNTNNKMEDVDLNLSEELQSVYIQAINKMSEMINNGLNGYVVVSKNEILIMDTDDKETAKNVWRFNSGGIAFSSTGYNGEYTVGMTMDGHINGALITAGSIKGEMLEAGSITTRELAVEIQTTINTAMTEEKTKAMITANLNEFESNLSQTFITQENASKQIQDATEVAVKEATDSIVNSAVEQAMDSVNDQLDGKLSDYTTNTLSPALQDAMEQTLQDSKDYVIGVTGDYYTKDETNSIISQTREEIEMGISEVYETKESTSIKIGEAIDGINIGSMNRVLGTSEEKSYTFTGILNESWEAYDIISDITDKDVIVSFKYDLNAEFQNGSTLKFQSQYLSTSNMLTYLPVYDIIVSDRFQTINVTNQQVSFVTKWNALQQDAKFRFRADGVTGTFVIREAQIKVGNKITNWSIAPEDIENNSNIYVAQQLSNYYTKEQTDSKINITKEEINLGVSTTYETKANVETIFNNTINETNSMIQTTLEDYYTKEETDSAIEVAKEEITLEITSIAETTEVIKTLIDKVDNLEIGATNLLIGTSIPKIVVGNAKEKQVVKLYPIMDSDEHFCGLSDSQVVLSFDYEISENSAGSFKIQTDGDYQKSLGESSGAIIDLSDEIFAPTTSTILNVIDEKNNIIIDENGNKIVVGQSYKGHISKSLILTNQSSRGFAGVHVLMTGVQGEIKFSNMKLERGNIETDWSPSPDESNSVREYYTKEETLSQINVAKDEITNTVSKKIESEFSGVTIGSENLLPNSDFAYELSQWTTYDMTDDLSAVKSIDVLLEELREGMNVLKIQGTNVDGRYGITSLPIILIANTEYTISGYCTGQNIDLIRISIKDIDGHKIISSCNVEPSNNTNFDTLSSFNQFKHTFKTTKNSVYTVNIYGVDFGENAFVLATNIKLELGSIATAWSPSKWDTEQFTLTLNNVIKDNVSDLSNMLNQTTSSDAIIPSMKVKLSSEYRDAISLYEKLKSMYNTVGNKTFGLLMTELNVAKEELTQVISQMEIDMLNTSETGLSAILEKFNKFYTSSEALHEAITNSLSGMTKETFTKVSQLSDSYNITASKVENLGGSVDEITTHFSFATDGLTIKSTENASKTIKLDNDSLDFLDNGNRVAQISDQQLSITNADVLNELKIGSIKLKPSGRGGILFVFEE